MPTGSDDGFTLDRAGAVAPSVRTSRGPDGSAVVQRCAGGCGPIPCDYDDTVQAAAQPGREPTSSVAPATVVPKGGGDPVPPALRDVRIHTDFAASGRARAVAARAYTVGRDIVFGAGKTNLPPRRRPLIAHELAHVVQQSGGDRRVARFSIPELRGPREPTAPAGSAHGRRGVR